MTVIGLYFKSDFVLNVQCPGDFDHKPLQNRPRNSDPLLRNF